MIKELKDKTNNLAKKIATEYSYEDKVRIKKLTKEIKSIQSDYLKEKVTNINDNLKKSYKKNIDQLIELKINNMVSEIKSLDPNKIILDVEKELEGINSRYNDVWLKSEVDVVEARCNNDYNFDNYQADYNDDNSALVVWHTENDACDECSPFEGTALPPNDSFWDSNMPGEVHPNCRCYTSLEYDTQPSDGPSSTKSYTSDEYGKIFDIE